MTRNEPALLFHSEVQSIIPVLLREASMLSKSRQASKLSKSSQASQVKQVQVKQVEVKQVKSC